MREEFLTPFSFVAVEFSQRYEKSKDGTKSPWYESSMVRKIHKWYETSMARKVYGTKSLVPDRSPCKEMIRNYYYFEFAELTGEFTMADETF